MPDIPKVPPDKKILLTREKSAKTGERLPAASARTRDRYAADLKMFAAWMVRDHRFGPIGTSPFEAVQSTFREGDERKERMSLTVDELQRLADAAAEAGDRTSRNRCVLYLFAGLTGLRRNECIHLTWGRIIFNGDSFVAIRGKQAAVAKNRRSAEVPLVPWLVDVLREERVEQARYLGRPVGAQDRVFRWMPTDSHALPRLVRQDAERAKLPTRDEEGRILDFHALRGSCCTILLAEGIEPYIVQQIMRHSTIEMTMRHYAKVRRTDLQSAVKRVGRPRRQGGAS